GTTGKRKAATSPTRNRITNCPYTGGSTRSNCTRYHRYWYRLRVYRSGPEKELARGLGIGRRYLERGHPYRGTKRRTVPTRCEFPLCRHPRMAVHLLRSALRYCCQQSALRDPSGNGNDETACVTT